MSTAVQPPKDPVSEPAAAPAAAPPAEDTAKLQSMYGNLKKKDTALRVLNKGAERKYFDSGEYAMCKADKASTKPVGKAIPTPESIPHGHSQHKHSKLAD